MKSKHDDYWRRICELSILDKTHGEVLRARCDVGMIQ